MIDGIEHKQIEIVFARICRDSGYRLAAEQAALLTGRVLRIEPLKVWDELGLNIMDQIAAGKFPRLGDK